MCARAVVFAACATVLAAGFVSAPPTAKAEESGRSVLLILDASGSMKQPMPDGRTRFQSAQAAVSEMLGQQADGTRVGLRVYGHQSDPAEKNCTDTELVSALDAVESNRSTMLDQVASLNARGYTPITLSLQRAAEDMAQEPSAERVIVLVSDGRETCKADPCAAARALAAANVALVVHTIGLDVDVAARTQLQCIASVARGDYYDAATSSELGARLAEAVAKGANDAEPAATDGAGYLSVEGVEEFGVPISDESGELVGSVGTIDPKKALPPGIYSVAFANGSWTGIEIKAGETTVITPAYLKIVTPAKDNLYLIDAETGEELGGFFMGDPPAIAVLPGLYSAKTSLPFLWTGIALEPGETTVIEPALLRIVHQPENTEFIFYRIVQEGTGIEGSAVNGSDLALPPGRYRIDDPDREGTAVEVEIGAGEVKEVAVDR